jgi:hypothetical protein
MTSDEREKDRIARAAEFAELFPALDTRADIMKFALPPSLVLLLGLTAAQATDASSVRFGAV